MNAMVQTLNTAGRAFVEFAVPMLLQSSVLILILLAVDAVLRKRVRAVFRYWIWMLVLVKLVLPPSLWSPVSVGTWLGDRLEVSTAVLLEAPEPPSVESRPAESSPIVSTVLYRPQRTFVEPPKPEPRGPAAPGWDSTTLEGGGAASSLPRPPILSLNWQGLALLVWAAVVTALLLLLAQRTFFVRGLVVQADEGSPAVLRELDLCRQRMGLRRPISLRLSPHAASPAVCGLWRPTILVPQNVAARLHGADLQAVLFHELAHVKRGDLWINLVQTLLQILYFYHPLLWLANMIIRRIREKAVDETVLVALGEAAPQYPETLVHVAQLALARRPTLSLRLIGVVESKSALTGRIRHILNRPLPKTAKLGVLGFLIVLVAAAALLPMAKAKPVAPNAQDATASTEEQRSTVDKDSAVPRFTAALPNGVAVELLGIGPHPLGSKPWWRPDGSPLPEAPYDGIIEASAVPPVDKTGFWLAVRAGNLPEGWDARLESPGTTYDTSDNRPGKAGQAQDDLRWLMVEVDPNQTTCALRCNVTGPWQTVTRGSVKEIVGRPAGGTDIVLSGSQLSGTWIAAFEVTTHLSPLAWQVVAVTPEGQVKEANTLGRSVADQTARVTVFFPGLSLSSIQELRIQTRSVTSVEFQNVPLRPGLKTNVKVQVQPGDTNLGSVLSESGEREKAASATKDEGGGGGAAEPGIAPHGVNIYLLADENIDLKTARAKPLSELVLRKEPWIASADIERYDLSTHAIYLKNPKPLLFARVALAGNPFVVTADGQRCYLGSLWTIISSFLPEPNTPLIDDSFDTPLPPDVVRIKPPGGWWRPAAPAQDVCRDPRIVQALAAHGQLHAGLEIGLDRVEVLPREGGSSVRYTYTLRNKDTDDLYVLDPNKISPWLFHYFNVPFLLSTRDHKGLQADTSLLEPPAKFPDQLDMAWLSLLKSGASITRTVTVPAFRYIPPDQYTCSFRFGSPGRLATKDKRERADGRIWLGQIEASLNLDLGPAAQDTVAAPASGAGRTNQAQSWQDVGRLITPDANDRRALAPGVVRSGPGSDLAPGVVLEGIGHDVEGKTFIRCVRNVTETRDRQYRFVLIPKAGPAREPSACTSVELADSGSVLETFAFDQPYDRSQIAGFRLQSRPAVEGSSSGTPSVRDQIQAVAKGKPAVSRERPPGRYALAFDGKKDYLFIPDSPSLQANPPYFIEAWIKPDIEPSDDGSGQGLLAKGAIIEGGTKSLLQGLGMRLERRTREPTALFVDAMLSVGDKMVPASSGHYLNKPNGQWVHAGGAFQPGGISGMGDVSALGQPLVVGRFLTPTEKPFKGLIGEVRIWRYVGSMSGWGSGEEPLTGNEPGLIACWTFEEGRGQIAYDISPNHNHARLGNSLGVDGADPKWVDLSATPELAKAVDSSTAKPEKKESAGSALELRIAPQQDELAPGVVDECRKALAEGRAPADNHYIWLPVRPGMNLPRLAVIQAQESRTWLLVHNNDPFIMVPAQGWHLRQVARTTDDNGRSAVAVYFDDGGTERLRQLTKANGDHPLAEIVNGVVICAPMIVKSPSGLPSIVIVGNFTDQEIDSLIATLRQGEGEPAGKGAGGGALAEPAPSAAAPQEISGRVVDPNGRPVAGAQVSVTLGGDAPLGLFFNEHGHLWFEVHNRSSDEIEINTGPLSQDENGQGEWGSIEVRAEAGTPVVYVWREAPMLGKVPARRNCKVGDFVNGMPLRKSGPGVYRARLTLRVRNTRTGESIFVPSNWHTFRVTPAGRLPGQAHGPYQEFQEAYAYGAACGFGYGSRAEAIQQLLTVAQKYAGTKYALAAYFEAANQADALAHETGEEVYRAKRRELFREIIQRWPDVVSHETIYARLHVQFGTSEAAFLQSRRDAYRWLLSVTQEQKIASLKGYTNLPSGRVADEDVRRALPALNQYIDLMKKMLEQSIPGLDPGDAPSQARQRGVGINS